MPPVDSRYFALRDVFIDYEFEEVMFRWDYKEEIVYRKFYGESGYGKAIPHDNNLFNQAILSGEEISQAEFMLGRARK